MAKEGARARFRGVPARLKALPHPSARDHLNEVMIALWKDAAKGRVLLRTNVHEHLLSKVVSAPMAR
eukprot:3820502-Pyramimonas_sp.AAC.1